MKLRILAYLSLVLWILLWPPIYSHYFEGRESLIHRGEGRMEDFELQLMLGAKRWVLDIPADKDGWILNLEAIANGQVKAGGGCSVHGGEQLVLLTRHDKETKRIDYVWYQHYGTGYSHCSGSIEDPLGSAGSRGEQGGGAVKLDEPIYFGNIGTEIQMHPLGQYDYEVRVGLHK